MRLIVPRGRPHRAPSALFEESDEWRHQVMATDTAAQQLAFRQAPPSPLPGEDRIHHP
jgi:hypothetical protein